MTTSIDTNVLSALWDPSDTLNAVAQRQLDAAGGELLICGAVFGELLAEPGRSERFVVQFLTETRITVDRFMDEAIWTEAGRAYQKYAAARRKQRQPPPRRLLTDFIIGAHALVTKSRLLTLDQKIYRTSFPSLQVIGV